MSHFGLAAPNHYGETLRMHGVHKVLDVAVRDTYVTVIRQYPSHQTHANGLPVADRVVKEIYEVQDNKLVLVKEVEGKHTPAHYVQETISFPKE